VGVAALKPLVITGCQRSGTAYIAALITASGYWCSHERFFRELEWFGPKPTTVEASWAALPHLGEIDAHVVHQIRHPLSVVASMLSRRTFAGAGRRSARWAAKHVPSTRVDTDTEVMWAMRYWLAWNLAVERHAHHMWRLEDLTPDVVAEVLTSCGRPVIAQRVEQGAAVLPERINGWSEVVPLSWDDLPAGKLRRQVVRHARRWGYSA
jgi:hypothetical protein